MDVSDSVQSPQGSTLKITVANFFATVPVPIIVTSTSTQLQLKYDGSNHVTVAVSSTGVVTLNATGASAGFTFQDNVVVTGTANSAQALVTGTNTTAGTAAIAIIRVLNDLSSQASIRSYSGSFTTAGSAIADSAAFVGDGAGGIVINAAHASGDIKLYNRGGTLAVTIGASQAATFVGTINGATITAGAYSGTIGTFSGAISNLSTKSASGTAAAILNTATGTVYAIPGAGMYQIQLFEGTTHWGYALAINQGASTTQTPLFASESGTTISVSGDNIQIVNNTGSTRTYSYVVQRIN